MSDLVEFLGKIRHIQSLMVLVSTGKAERKEKETEYRELREQMREYFLKFGITDPNPFSSLEEFYGYYQGKSMGWAKRRQFIRETYEKIENAIESALKKGGKIDIGERAGYKHMQIQKPKILFLTANPKSVVKLRLDEEVREIEQKVMLAQKKDQIILVNKGAVRIGDLQLYLNQERPTVVHFCGHGTSEGRIVLEDNSGNPRAVPPEALARVFEFLKDNIRCVVLNACFSSEQANAISQHIDCVVGMSSSISDKAAIAFTSAFYLAIASERSVRGAFDQGKTELMLCEIPEEHIPQLFVRRNIDSSEIFLLEPKRTHKKLKSIPRINREKAETIALELVRKKNEDVSEVEISGVNREGEEWVIKGAYSTSIEGSPWAFDFVVRMDDKGEVISYDFNA